MGIFKAVSSAAGSMAADQWKEFFYCNAIPDDRIMVRVKKQASAQSANNGSDDIITDGSIIAVADGQCAIVVSNGKVLSVFKEAGEHEFRSGDTVGVFSGSPARKFGKELVRRISFGGDAPAITHRVYYFNMKVIPGNRFGDGMEVPVRVYDSERGLDIDCALIMAGVYSFRICDPEKIYRQVTGNVKHVYMVSYLAEQMKADVDSTLLSAVGEICIDGFRPYKLGSFIPEIRDRVVEKANEMLRELRGVEIVNLAFDYFKLTDADTGMIKTIQLASVAKDPLMGGAMLASAQAEAMRDAAGSGVTGKGSGNE